MSDAKGTSANPVREAAGRSASSQPMLQVRGLVKTFNRGTAIEHRALDGIDLDVAPGEFVCIIGSNGAGKSTLLNAIAGEYLCDRGSIVVGGRDFTWKPEHKRMHDISRVFQDPMRGTAPHLTVAENVALAYSRSQRHPLAFATSKKRKAIIAERIADLGLGLGLEDKVDTQVGMLSGGQRQAITLLMAIIAVPKLLLLDEHTAALDPATADTIMQLTNRVVREQNLATLMITHSISMALASGDRTIMLDKGRVVMDIAGEERAHMTPADLMERYQSTMGQELDNDEIVLAEAQTGGGAKAR